jgi:chemotaxis protein methyltransferase CheR
MSITTTSTLNTPAFQFISKLVLNKSAIVLESSKTYLVESRLAPIVKSNGLKSIDELVANLQKPGSKKLTDEVVDAMTTNETRFFRDLHPFNALKSVILPKLIASRSKTRTLTIWSSACSSGQEVYSIAMLIREHFPELLGWRLKLLATDLSTQILDKAKSGRFSQTEINRGLPMPLLLKNFTRQGIHWKINDDIRRMIEFQELNLIETWPALPTIDIVFLRNVLIYFSVDTKKQILDRVCKSIASDGYLFLGGAESTMNLNVNFTREQVGAATCYRPK